ncbi:hypothetical protein [Kitasatospora sp. NPDC005748]|uniref:hypothetical protein n=1 Tax=Kitasatospora sp. NPDC005748 TaxID=3157063 RepID=UPI0033D48404
MRRVGCAAATRHTRCPRLNGPGARLAAPGPVCADWTTGRRIWADTPTGKDFSHPPPAGHYACTYLTDWTAEKTRWSLTADPREKTALTRLAAT